MQLLAWSCQVRCDYARLHRPGGDIVVTVERTSLQETAHKDKTTVNNMDLSILGSVFKMQTALLYH